MGRDWQKEADEDFLCDRESSVFQRIRRMLGATAADVLSSADIPSSITGAPGRNPNLRPGEGSDHAYHLLSETVAHTEIVVTDVDCPACGGVMERHTLLVRSSDQVTEETGRATVCHSCSPSHWLFESNMPSARAARSRKNVL